MRSWEHVLSLAAMSLPAASLVQAVAISSELPFSKSSERPTLLVAIIFCLGVVLGLIFNRTRKP